MADTPITAATTAAELGVPVQKPRKDLKSRGIELNSPQGFTFSVACQKPVARRRKRFGTKSCRARHRAALCQLEIAEKRTELIPSGPAVEFLAAALKVMYRTIRAF